jgi:hypothetical protein
MKSTNISLGASCESYHQSLSDECISEIARVKSSLVRIPLGGMNHSFFFGEQLSAIRVHSCSLVVNHELDSCRNLVSLSRKNRVLKKERDSQIDPLPA